MREGEEEVMFSRCGSLLLFGFGALSLLALPAAAREPHHRSVAHPQQLVIARNTAFTFKGKNIDSREISRELGVRYVLEGSVQRDQNRVQSAPRACPVSR
jgi:hypothetical protein